jgi:hypothetical protein
MKNRKIKYIAVGLILVIAAIALCGCSNMQVVDTTWKFDRAIISLADGTIVDGKVQSWKDFENSDMIQIKVNDAMYLIHSSNATLIAN